MEKHETQNWFERAKPFIAVVLLQFGYAIMDVLSKAAMNEGMSNYVFIVYRHVVASIFITPFALYFDNYKYKKVRTKMTMSIFMKIVLLSFLEPVIGQNLYFLGMKYTTATFAAAMTNILPASAFILACIFRLEKIKVKSIRSQAKVVGTIASVSGAMLMTLIKGPVLLGTFGGNSHNQYSDETNSEHILVGSIMIALGCFSCACFVILQAITLKTYPAPLSLASWICFLGTLETAVVAMIMEWCNPSVWYIKWDMRLLSIVYTGIVCSGVLYFVQGVVVKSRGPVFVTAVSPLCTVIVAIMGYFILAEELFLGRVIGAIVTCLGLYLVAWGKSKDYTPSEPVIQEFIFSTDEGNVKNEHFAQEIVTIQ
ncbi:WAT1-related protein [Trifolium repens]|nr:WAT1-related protein [Trifolium repens]